MAERRATDGNSIVGPAIAPTWIQFIARLRSDRAVGSAIIARWADSLLATWTAVAPALAVVPADRTALTGLVGRILVAHAQSRGSTCSQCRADVGLGVRLCEVRRLSRHCRAEQSSGARDVHRPRR
jgi:hypothetical protein